MTEAVSSWTVPCVTDLTVDFGPVAQLPYGPGGSQDIFVITSGTGVTGTVKLYEAQKRGNAILFTFNQPVCAGSTAPGTGLSTFFVGVASNGAPRAVTAKSRLAGSRRSQRRGARAGELTAARLGAIAVAEERRVSP